MAKMKTTQTAVGVEGRVAVFGGHATDPRGMEQKTFVGPTRSARLLRLLQVCCCGR